MYTEHMGIWDRFGNVVKSYFNDYGQRSRDPDLDSAYEELDDYLGKNGSRKASAWDEEKKSGEKKSPVPEDIKKDFAELGLTPEANIEECKEAYKKLLKIHHPDRHAKHDENMKKATDRTARVNAAYERLLIWFRISRTQ